MFRVQREHVKLTVLHWAAQWENMMTELGSDAKDLRSEANVGSVGVCLKEVREQMLMRLDEIGEDYVATAGHRPRRPQ